MPAEAPFRLALLALFAVTVLVVGYHRLQAAKSGERIVRRDEGVMLAVTLRLAGLCLWLATVAYLVNPAWMAWAQWPLPSWLRWIGAGAGLFFVVLIYWTLTNLGKNLTDTVMTRAAATLVTSGPYRLVRHPFYVCVGLLMVAVTLLSANGLIGFSGLLVMILLVVRTPKEEQKLIEKFGDAYRAYMATTGRFWPILRQR
jgi:protein-S-isoprenylcysteine O-methyltransferase Ste14